MNLSLFFCAGDVRNFFTTSEWTGIILRLVPIDAPCLFCANYDTTSHCKFTSIQYIYIPHSCPSPPTQSRAICSLSLSRSLYFFNTHTHAA